MCQPPTLALHPFGRVPAVVHDGFVLYETAAITRYIGVSIAPTNSTSATVTGTDSATVSYTMTVP